MTTGRSQRHLREIQGIDSGGNTNGYYDHTQTDGLHSLAAINGSIYGGAGNDELDPTLSEWDGVLTANEHGVGMFSFELGADKAGDVISTAILSLYSHVANGARPGPTGSGTAFAYINSANHASYATTYPHIDRANRTDDTSVAPFDFPSAINTLVDIDVTDLVNIQLAIPGFAGWIAIGISLDYVGGGDVRTVGMMQLDGTTTNPASRLVITQ